MRNAKVTFCTSSHSVDNMGMQRIVVLSFFVVVVLVFLFYLYGSLWSDNKLDLITH